MDGEDEAADAQKIYIGQLFGGGNGDYYYYNNGGTHEIYNSKQDKIDGKAPIASNTTDFIMPDIGKTYLELLGGSIVYAYGGGNNATITNRTVIALKNPSKVVNDIVDTSNPNANTDPSKGTVGELLTNERFEDRMGINTTFSVASLVVTTRRIWPSVLDGICKKVRCATSMAVVMRDV